MKKIVRKIVVIGASTFSLTSAALADLVGPMTPMSDNPATLPIEMICQQITLQCKTNQISASDCLQKMQYCQAAMVQARQQQFDPHNPNNPPQKDNANAQQPATNGNQDLHPAWHFGN